MVLTRMVSGFGAEAVAVQRVGGQIESVSWNTADGFGTALNVSLSGKIMEQERWIVSEKDTKPLCAALEYGESLLRSCLFFNQRQSQRFSSMNQSNYDRDRIFDDHWGE